MIFLLPLGLAAFFLLAWLYQRDSTLTRACRWRLDRTGGEGHFRCASCGAEVDLPSGKSPRHCLKT